MKKWIAVTLIVCYLYGMAGCGSDLSGVKIDYGQSEIYSIEDMDEAVRETERFFRRWARHGDELHRISYSGDAESMEFLAWINGTASCRDKKRYTQCILFTSDFHTAEGNRNDGFDPDVDYIGWRWLLARTDGGKWKMMWYDSGV